MPYLEEIKKAYESVRSGETSQVSIQKALQYENWKCLPDKISTKVPKHADYSLLAAGQVQPIPNDSKLPHDCQISRSKIKISLAYSLHRARDTDARFNMIDADDLPLLWEMLERGRKRGKRTWVTTNHLALRSEHDLHNLVCRLGLYHWRGISNLTVFCLELRNIQCVKPNALDAGLAFYFRQTSEQTPGSTRNLQTGEADMEEWLCFNVVKSSIKCTGGCLTHQKITLDMSNYYKNNAQRIRG